MVRRPTRSNSFINKPRLLEAMGACRNAITSEMSHMTINGERGPTGRGRRVGARKPSEGFSTEVAAFRKGGAGDESGDSGGELHSKR